LGQSLSQTGLDAGGNVTPIVGVTGLEYRVNINHYVVFLAYPVSIQSYEKGPSGINLKVSRNHSDVPFYMTPDTCEIH
jgi:hypothetical protein